MFAEREEQLYQPVRSYLQKQFAQFGECEFEITTRKIPQKVRRRLDDLAISFIRGEKIFPDIMGYFKPDPSKNPPHGFHEGLIVTEVKAEQPRIQDILQIKLYAEVFDASFAYLISSDEMIEDTRRFLSERRHILSYYAREYPRKIYIGWFRHIGFGCVWYPENPFKRF